MLSFSSSISVTKTHSEEADNFSEVTGPNGVSIAALVAEIWPFEWSGTIVGRCFTRNGLPKVQLR